MKKEKFQRLFHLFHSKCPNTDDLLTYGWNDPWSKAVIISIHILTQFRALNMQHENNL